MKQVWIVGAGKFGRKAARMLSIRKPEAEITVIDNDKSALDRLRLSRIDRIEQDGIVYLVDNLVDGDYPNWIVPAVPIHLAYEWIAARMIEKHCPLVSRTIPDRVIAQLPNPIKGAQGQVYMSIADFICPDHCSEPERLCTVTGKPRPMILYQKLMAIQSTRLLSIVIRSHQLAPGVGGYTPNALFSALRQIFHTDRLVLLSTACKCHGVMHAFETTGGSVG